MPLTIAKTDKKTLISATDFSVRDALDIVGYLKKMVEIPLVKSGFGAVENQDQGCFSIQIDIGELSHVYRVKALESERLLSIGSNYLNMFVTTSEVDLVIYFTDLLGEVKVSILKDGIHQDFDTIIFYPGFTYCIGESLKHANCGAHSMDRRRTEAMWSVQLDLEKHYGQNDR
jgi:hypothetical protein